MVSSLRRRASWPLIAVTALALAACQPPKVTDPKDPAFVVAETKDWKITRAELDHEVNDYLKESGATPAQIGDRMPALETFKLRNMVVDKLILAKADPSKYKDLDKTEAEALAHIKGQFPSEQAYQEKLKQTGMTEDELKRQIHDRAIMERYMESEVIKDADPTEKEVNDFYLGHQNLFQVPLKLRASTVLVLVDEKATPAQKAAARKKIDAARARVAKGESFSKVATEVSDDKYTGPKGGDTGYFQRGENEPEFDNVAFASKVGQLSKVFESPMGYHFLEVTETKPAGIAPIDDVRAQIFQYLRGTKVKKEEQDYVKKLLKDSNVTFNIPLTELPTQPAPGTATTDGQPPANGAEAAPAPAATNAAPGP